MPFDPKKKPKREPGPPTYQQEASLRSIDGAFTDLEKALTYVSANNPEMKLLIGQLAGVVDTAKKWVLEN